MRHYCMAGALGVMWALGNLADCHPGTPPPMPADGDSVYRPHFPGLILIGGKNATTHEEQNG